MSLFSVSILAFLWLFQITFLNIFYEFSKTNKMHNVAKTVELKYDDYNLLDRLAYDNDLCIEITNDVLPIYSTNQYGSGCMTQETSKNTYKTAFINSGSHMKAYKLINEKYDNQTLVYALKLEDNTYAFISSSLVPLEATTKILAQQFIYVSLGVLILSFIIAIYISKYLTKPIVNLNQTALKMAEGDYTPNFDTDSNIAEIDDLGHTLNYACTELSKTEELQRELMANVSHDLKTPLTMIKAYAEMARDLNCDNQKKRNQNLNVIIEEADRLNVLVNDILDLSKIQSNVVNLEYQEFNLNKLIKTILKRYSYLKEDGIKFILDADREYNVQADFKRIEQVLYNLINNAVNFVGKDKEVIIKLTDKDDKVLVEVIDHGKGIKEQELKLIWNKYYKVDKKYRRNNVGSGIGLSIVKSILESHGVNYGVNSEVGKGTTFYFELNKK